MVVMDDELFEVLQQGGEETEDLDYNIFGLSKKIKSDVAVQTKLCFTYIPSMRSCIAF
jgi:hypothetical protein